MEGKQPSFPQVFHVTWNERTKIDKQSQKNDFAQVYGTLLFTLIPQNICKANDPKNVLKTRETCSALYLNVGAVLIFLDTQHRPSVKEGVAGVTDRKTLHLCWW